MAKTLRLEGDIQGHAGQALTYKIYSDLGVGLTTSETVKATLADGVKFTWDAGDVSETWAPMMSSTADLRFILDSDTEIDAFIEMNRGTENDTYVVIEQDNGWRWMGSLLPEESAVEIVDGYTEVGMTFTDGLSLLKGLDFRVDADDVFIRGDETAGAPYQPGRTTLGLAWVILNKIPWMQEVTWPAGTEAITEIPGIGWDTAGTYGANLPYTAMNPAAFSKESRRPRRGRQMPKPKSFVNCYDVLGDICETFGYRLSWDGQGWRFTSHLVADDFAGSGGLGTSFLHSDLLANGRGSETGSLSLKTWQYDLDASYAMSSGAVRNFGQKFSGARAIHTEAGSNQLWTRRDNVVIGAAQNFQDLNDGVMKQSEPLMEFEAESDINLRYQGYFDLKGGLTAKNAGGHKPVAVVKLKLGTTSNAADPYLLSSEMLVQGYDTTITGAAAASAMRCWANATLPDAEWVLESSVQNKLDGMPDPYDTPGVLYIPLTWGGDNFNPSAPSVDHGADGTFYGGLHTTLKNGETNVLKYDKWGQLHFDVSLPTIVTPNSSLEGYEMEVGLAFFGANAQTSGDWTGESIEVLNTVYARDTETFVHTLDSACETLYDNYIEKFVLHKIRFNKGDGTGDADRIYFEEVDNGATDALEFAEVRVASGLQNGVVAQGPKFINRQTTPWNAVSNPSNPEAWTYDTDWVSYSGTPTTNPTTKENLELLADEWIYVNGSGVEGISANFAPTYLSSSSMPTGSSLFGTSCVTVGNGTDYYVPTRFTWSSISGLDMEGYLVAKDTTLTPFRSAEDPEETPDGAKPFLKDTSAGLGGTTNALAKSIDEVDGATNFVETFTKSSTIEVHGPSGNRGIGGPQKMLLNGNLTQTATEVTQNVHFVAGMDETNVDTSVDVLKMGLSDFDISRAAAGTWNTADGGLTVHAWLDTDSATDADVLSYNNSTGKVEWAAQTGGSGGGATDLDSLSDVTLTSSVTGDMLVNIGGTFRNTTAAATATTLAGNIDLEDLRNVESVSAADNDVLQYDNSTSEWQAVGVGTILANGSLNDLNGVTVSGASSGEYLKFNGLTWTADSIPSTPSLDDVTTVSGVTTNDITVGNVDANIVTAAELVTGSPIGGFLTYPDVDGTSGQVLKTDGAGNLDFADEETNTLDSVTDNGSTTTNDITVGELTTTDGAFIEGAGSNPYLTSLVAKAGASSVFTQHWEDSSGVLKAYMFPTGNFVTAGTVFSSQLGVSSQYSLPTTAGTAGQVLTFPASGTAAEWTTAASGSSNPIYNFDKVCYNSVTTTTDQYYWLPGSSTYGFEFYDGNELSTLSTLSTWNRYKKLSHRLPSGTYDLDCFLDISMSNSSNGTTHASDYAGQDVEIYLYKVARSGANGNVTFTQLGTTQNNTQDSTDTAVGTETTVSLTGQTFDGEERLMVVLKGTINQGGTRYAHWAYDVQAEKTA